MSQHTPGPWFVHDFADPAIVWNPSPAHVTVSCDHPATITVASMDNALTATLEEARANARLIAAAPDMLAALRASQAALAMLTAPDAIKSTSVQHAWAQAVEAESKVRAAIERAEG